MQVWDFAVLAAAAQLVMVMLFSRAFVSKLKPLQS